MAARRAVFEDVLPSHVQVQPVLQRLKTTLTGSGAALLMSSVLLFGLIRAGTDADGMYGERLLQSLCHILCWTTASWMR